MRTDTEIVQGREGEREREKTGDKVRQYDLPGKSAAAASAA